MKTVEKLKRYLAHKYANCKANYVVKKHIDNEWVFSQDVTCISCYEKTLLERLSTAIAGRLTFRCNKMLMLAGSGTCMVELIRPDYSDDGTYLGGVVICTGECKTYVEAYRAALDEYYMIKLNKAYKNDIDASYFASCDEELELKLAAMGF